MNEPKRRGRPPKAKPCADCGQVVGHHDDCPVGMAEAVQSLPPAAKALSIALMKEAVFGKQTGPVLNGDTTREPEDVLPNKAQAYADRVWAGQSPSADRPWRVERVRLALEGQGLSFEGVVLP